MNKTVNINLAGTFFHIDENAFGKLQRYLEAIRKSLSDPQGSDEIIRDIEARIAELFSEKSENNAQVISIKELDEVITVMGQPEDYMVDEEIFEDAPSTSKARPRSSYKQLFRDIDRKFIAGVSSGLGHYLGFDALWVRLIWILLTIFSSGFFIIIYILFWILVPAAESTSDKLKMSGEAVTISNIEKKLKEQFENATEKVKNADYDKYGKKITQGASGFFETMGSIFLTLLKIFVKFLGVLLIIISLSTLVGLIVGLFTLGSAGFWGHGEFMDYVTLVDTTNTALWLVSLLTLFAVGIPFFVLFILGLKLLIDNLKSLGTPIKITLLAVWLVSLIGLGILAIKQATEQAYEGEFISEKILPIHSGDTLNISMRANTKYEYSVRRSGGLEIKYTQDNEKIIYSNDIRLIVRSSRDSVAKLFVEKKAQGNSYVDAKNRAEAIRYEYTLDDNSLLLDGFFITDFENKYRDQEVEIVLYLPVGTILYADENTYSFHRNDSRYDDILDNGDEEQYLRILNGRTECLDCPKRKIEIRSTNDSNPNWEEDLENRFNNREDVDHITIDKDGLDINITNEEDTLRVKIGN